MNMKCLHSRQFEDETACCVRPLTKHGKKDRLLTYHAVDKTHIFGRFVYFIYLPVVEATALFERVICSQDFVSKHGH